MEDPTSSESYVALRNALIAIKDDTSAVRSILSAVSDGGEGWAKTAHFELRRALVQGRLSEAATVGQLIGHVLALGEPGTEDEELSEHKIHCDAMRALEEGIGAILGQDNLTGIQHLEALTEAVYGDPSLRWIAWFWMARAAADDGNLERAMKASLEALKLGKELDPRAHGSSLCRLADVEFLREEYDGALEHATKAAALFQEIGDRRGLATARLAVARMLDKVGREQEALVAAREAQEADPDWEDPAIYLSQRALLGEDLDGAEAALEVFMAMPRSQEVDRQSRLAAAVRSGRVPCAVAVELVRLRGEPAAAATVEALDALWNEHRDFLELREVLAWHLVKVGRDEEAAAHFGEMANAELAPELRSSVMLGLGCLANRQFKHRQPGARVHATSEAFTRAADRGVPDRGVPDRGVPDRGVPDTALDNPAITFPMLIGAQGPAHEESEEAERAHDETFEFDTAALDDAMDQLGLHEETDLTPPPPKPVAPVVAAAKPPPVPADAKPVVAARPRAVFTGSLQLFAVPDLLDFLSTSRRTGTLVITSERGIGAIHMKEGFIAGAAAPDSASMGDLLVQGAALTQAALDEAVQRQRGEGGGRLLGVILLEMGLVEQAQLRVALEKQAKGALREMVEWTEGRFAFEPDRGAEPPRGEIELNLDTRSVLLDVLREFDEDNK